MVLPNSLQNKAIELAHRGSHPGRSGIERRLRYHFFFHNMLQKVKDFVEKCETCSIFVDKKTTEPIRCHENPAKCWDTVAVDLFGPMPSSKHVVVVEDIASRFPAAKLVTSTKADKVIPVLEDIYNTYGNPSTQISDNGPPFNSLRMKNFAKDKGIDMRFVPPHCPNANPAETFMKTVGKAMKSAHYNKHSEKEVLQKAVSNYIQTPHPATGLPPGAILFRDGIKDDLPRKSASQYEVDQARARDQRLKKANEDKVNASKYRKESEFQPGELVLLRNFNKTSKFDPIFNPEPYMILEVDPVAKKLVLESSTSRQTIRHPDDVKSYHGGNLRNSIAEDPSHPPVGLSHSNEEYEDDVETVAEDSNENVTAAESAVESPSLRRSERQRALNQRYFNDDFSN